MDIKITSSAFAEGGMIPKRYTCDSEDVSPDLSWSGVPEGTQSIALICDDPFNLPADLTELTTAVGPDKILANGGLHGKNDFGRLGYGGPCPPGGTHRYFFKLYALDIRLDLDSGISKAQLLVAMEGHILAEGQLMGKYTR
jgi:Raf kinase inhibitor-like YbhB/YbcL family protein